MNELRKRVKRVVLISFIIINRNVLKNKIGFFPKLLVKRQWKEMVTKYTDWKEFYLEVKNSKLKYRVSLDEVKTKFKVF